LLDGTEIDGVVGSRAFPQPTREHVYLMVNGRPVGNRAMLAAAEAGYRPLLRKGRHPLLVARITVAAGDLDPNVHPARTGVLLGRGAGMGGARGRSVRAVWGTTPLRVDAANPRPAAPRFARPVQLLLPAPRNRRGLPLAEGRIPYFGGYLDEDGAPPEK